MIRIEKMPDGAIFVALDDLADWDEFVRQNSEALIEQYGSAEVAYRHCIDGGLVLGGGAMPEIGVYFCDGNGGLVQ